MLISLIFQALLGYYMALWEKLTHFQQQHFCPCLVRFLSYINISKLYKYLNKLSNILFKENENDCLRINSAGLCLSNKIHTKDIRKIQKKPSKLYVNFENGPARNTKEHFKLKVYNKYTYL